MPTTRSVTAPQARDGSQNSAESVTAISTTAVRMRALSTSAARRELFAGPPVAALAALVRENRLVQRCCVEIRPEQIGEVELGVGELPEKKVRDALLAAGTDEEIRLRRICHRQVRLQRLGLESAHGFGPGREQSPRRLRDVPTAAV